MDDVYVIGDFAVRNFLDETWYLKQLKGHKHLVIGNHDDRLLQNEQAMKYFESVDKILGLRDTLNGEEVEVVINNYTPASFNELIRNKGFFRK